MENINNYRIADTCENCKFSIEDFYDLSYYCNFHDTLKYVHFHLNNKLTRLEEKQIWENEHAISSNAICDNFEKG